MNTPSLETKRLLLRPFESGDVQAVFDGWEQDPEVAKYMYWTSHHDIHKTEQWIKSEVEKIADPDWYRFAIVEKSSGKLIGTGLIYLNEEKEYDIAYNLTRSAWGHGYTTEAMKEIVRFAKETLHIKEVVGACAKINKASAHVMEKLGLKFVETIDYYANNGACHYEGSKYKAIL